jgi:UPF0716 protein FxsA
MAPLVILGIVAYAVLEWFAASWLAGLIGWLGVVVVVALLVIIGSAVMRRAGFAAARSLRPVSVDGATVMPGMTQQRAGEVGREVGDASMQFVAGLLIALPGLVTSAVGLLLMIRPLRELLRRRVSRSVRRRAEAAGLVIDTATVTSTTVQGAVVRDDEPARPVRGEIISGEIVRDDQPPSG